MDDVFILTSPDGRETIYDSNLRVQGSVIREFIDSMDRVHQEDCVFPEEVSRIDEEEK